MKQIVVVLFLLAVFAPPGASFEELRLEDSVEAMGSTYSLVLYGEDRSRLEGASEDAFEEDNETIVYTAPAALPKIHDALKEAGIDIVEAEVTFVPNSNLEIKDPETARKVLNLLDAVEDVEDVTAAHSNFELSEGVKI